MTRGKNVDRKIRYAYVRQKNPTNARAIMREQADTFDGSAHHREQRRHQRQLLVDDFEQVVEKEDERDVAEYIEELDRKPQALVVEVAYDHMQGGRFRHTAQSRRWRDDKRPHDCTFDQLEVVPPQELAEIFASSR